MMKDLTEALDEIPLAGWATIATICFIILLGASEEWAHMTNYPSWALHLIALIFTIAAVSAFFKSLVLIITYGKEKNKSRKTPFLEPYIEEEIQKMTEKQISMLENAIQKNKLYFTVDKKDQNLEAIASLGIIIKVEEKTESNENKQNIESDNNSEFLKYYINNRFIRDDFLKLRRKNSIKSAKPSTKNHS